MNSTAASTTQLKQMFSELSKEGTKTSDVFKEIAGKSFKEFIAEGHNVNDALQLMEEYARANGLEINDLFSSVQAGQAALMLTGESAEMFATNIERMGDSAGATQQAYQTMDASIGRSFEKIKVAMADMLLELGDNLAPAVASATDFILMIMPVIQTLVEGVFGAIGIVIETFVDILGWMLDNLFEAVSSNEEAWNSISETISSIIGTIKEIIQVFVNFATEIWEKYGNTIMEFTKKIWGLIADIFDNAFKIIKGVLDVFIGLVTGDWDRFGQGLKTIAENFWGLIKNVFTLALEAIKGILRGAITVFTNLGKAIMQGLHDGFKFIWDLVTEWFGEIFENLFEWFEEKAKGFFNVGKDMFDYMWSGMKSIWESIKTWVSEKTEWLKDKLTFWRKSKDEMDEGIGDRREDSRPGERGSGRYVSYDVGTPYVPNDQLAFIHKGEAVIPAKYNPYNPANRGRLEPATQTTNNHYHISKLEFPNVRDAREIENAIGNLSHYATQWANRE